MGKELHLSSVPVIGFDREQRRGEDVLVDVSMTEAVTLQGRRPQLFCGSSVIVQFDSISISKSIRYEWVQMFLTAPSCELI